MRLTHPMLGIFIGACEGSFDQAGLSMLLLQRFGLHYARLTNAGLPWGTQVIDVHRYFDFRNTTEQLALALRDARPNVPEFAAVADHLGFAHLSRTGLEVLVRAGATPYQDVEVFRAGLSQIEAAICQIECGASAGTGSLIAADLVMTNHHVVAERLGANGELAGPVLCRFDYKTNGANYATPATEVTAMRVLASSPHAPEDTVVGPMATNPLALDYAVLKLERALGQEPIVAGGLPRGYLDINAPPRAAANAGVIVMQHPGGQPMKIDIGSILDVGETRFRHSVNTESGSSGAPLLSASLKMVGIHHAGHDNGLGPSLTYNEAVPLGAILADARAKGVRF